MLRRNRIEVVYYTPKGSRLQWNSRKGHSLPPGKMVEFLRDIAGSIEKAEAIEKADEGKKT